MANSEITKLFSEILDRQKNTSLSDTISEQRLYEAFTDGINLSDDERQLIIQSPILRYKCVNVINQVNDEIKENIRLSQIQTELMPLAADNDEKEVHFETNDFDIYLYNKSDLGIPWIIVLQLSSKITDMLYESSKVRLYDSGGLDWLIGTPDDNGQIIFEWQDDETNLVERSRMYSLHIEPF